MVRVQFFGQTRRELFLSNLCNIFDKDNYFQEHLLILSSLFLPQGAPTSWDDIFKNMLLILSVIPSAGAYGFVGVSSLLFKFVNFSVIYYFGGIRELINAKTGTCA